MAKLKKVEFNERYLKLMQNTFDHQIDKYKYTNEFTIIYIYIEKKSSYNETYEIVNLCSRSCNETAMKL